MGIYYTNMASDGFDIDRMQKVYLQLDKNVTLRRFGKKVSYQRLVVIETSFYFDFEPTDLGRTSENIFGDLFPTFCTKTVHLMLCKQQINKINNYLIVKNSTNSKKNNWTLLNSCAAKYSLVAAGLKIVELTKQNVFTVFLYYVVYNALKECYFLYPSLSWLAKIQKLVQISERFTLSVGFYG